MKHLTILAAIMAMTFSAKALKYNDVKDDALFLTDKMAYELNLTDEQYEAVYEINLDYLLCLNTSDDLFGEYWKRRNADLRYVLSDWQYKKYLEIEYFYRPVKWEADAWVFIVYTHYARDLFYFTHPRAFDTYHGGNNFKHNHFYADRIPNKPASADHQHGPAAYGTKPAASAAPNANAKPATPNNSQPKAPNNNKPSTPNTNDRPATPNNVNRPTMPNNGGARPAGGPGGPGGGRPAGGPGGGGPGGPGGRR
ncbi:MAG: hypothetical protein J6S87_00220 [Bacteroidales bacterium]|nr:hypothetical protein [Bacteroidales bacterium]